jgi:hypothetical protein
MKLVGFGSELEMSDDSVDVPTTSHTPWPWSTVVDTGTRGELVPYRTLGTLSAWPNSTQRFHPIGVATISGSTYLRSSTTSPNSLIYSCIQIILDSIKIRRVLAITMIVRALSIAICECGPSRRSTIAFQGANGPVPSTAASCIGL